MRNSPFWTWLRPQHGAARAGEEARLYEKHHRVGLDDRNAVEALDRETLRSPASHVLDESREGRAKPLGIGLSKRNERATASLDEEHGLATEKNHPRSGDSRGTGAGAPRPRNRRAVRLRGIGCGKHEGLSLLVTKALRPELAQALDGAGLRELRSPEAFDEVSAPAHAQRLERSQFRVHGSVSPSDALATNAVARHDSLPLEQELRQRAPVRLAGEERCRQRPPALGR